VTYSEMGSKIESESDTMGGVLTKTSLGQQIGWPRCPGAPR
jgi:hypothetical protein